MNRWARELVIVAPVMENLSDLRNVRGGVIPAAQAPPLVSARNLDGLTLFLSSCLSQAR